MKKAILIITLALGASSFRLLAEDAGGPPQGERPPRRGGPQQGGPGDEQGGGTERPRRPVPAIIAALDANHDGVIDEQEIANASAALKTLDKNGDGKLTMDEIRPPHQPGPGGPGEGRGQVPGGGQGPGGGAHRGPPPPQE